MGTQLLPKRSARSCGCKQKAQSQAVTGSSNAYPYMSSAGERGSVTTSLDGRLVRSEGVHSPDRGKLRLVETLPSPRLDPPFSWGQGALAAGEEGLLAAGVVGVSWQQGESGEGSWQRPAGRPPRRAARLISMGDGAGAGAPPAGLARPSRAQLAQPGHKAPQTAAALGHSRAGAAGRGRRGFPPPGEE